MTHPRTDIFRDRRRSTRYPVLLAIWLAYGIALGSLAAIWEIASRPPVAEAHQGPCGVQSVPQRLYRVPLGPLDRTDPLPQTMGRE